MSNKPKKESTEEALQLNTILEEEYEYIHKPDGSQFIAQFVVHNPSELITKLNNENQQEWAIDEREDSSKRKLLRSTSVQEVYYQTPYTRLAEWVNKENNVEITKELIIRTLEEKANDEHLLSREIWLLDAASRPYTRSFVKEYQKTVESKKSDNPQEKPLNTRKLNQLLLEDAFSDYILPQDSSGLSYTFNKLLNRYHCALCLSGGGIRSATFALGVIQGLAQHNLLDRFEYLSTVSGGGYVGSWLSAWIHHEGFDKVLEKLQTPCDTPVSTEPGPIQHLRKFSNYLSPQFGLFSADTWTLVATYIRNLLMVWLVVIPFLAALVALPWVFLSLGSLDLSTNGFKFLILGIFIAIALASLVYAAKYIHDFVPESEYSRSDHAEVSEIPENKTRDQIAFIRHCLLPLSASVLMLTIAWMWFSHLNTLDDHWSIKLHSSLGLNHPTGLTVLSVGGGLIILGVGLVHFLGWILAIPTSKTRWLQIKMAIAITITGAFAGFLMLLEAKLLRSLINIRSFNALHITFGLPCFLLAILFAGYVFEGIASRYNDDARREWTARYSAWVLIVAVSWLLLNGLVLYGPELVDDAKLKIATVGISSGFLTALLGWSAKTAGIGQGAGSRQGKGNSPTLLGLLSGFALPIAAILALLILLATLSRIDASLFRSIASMFHPLRGDTSPFSVKNYENIPPYIPLLVGGLLYWMSTTLAKLIDTNRFSLHAMYRARLIRAYLGASRPDSERNSDPFTGFDEKDNLPMGKLDLPDDRLKGKVARNSYKRGPFHIINLALNLTTGDKLAWQERKAESFTVSPLHAGATNLAYRRTRPKNDSNRFENEQGSKKLYGGKSGISLGTAMTISGAAASPNMGYHSSPLIAFLMTMFNVRLGWWLGNPGPAGNETFFHSTPNQALKPILDELFGWTNETNKYVYLSDGGHFENLGLYEMVLRRNRFIVVSDASCDEKCTLEDLGNAIRKIRIDLGIPIEFSSEFNIRARSDDPTLPPGQYWALARICYSVVYNSGDHADIPAEDIDGILLYIKPGFYGNEPRDIFNYALSKSAFPHESTGDQFFSESQFESYRALGKHALDTIHDTFQKKAGVTLEELFDKDGLGLKKHWAHMTS